MPELPEVEITKRSLTKHILYKKVNSVTIINPKLRYNLFKEKLMFLKGKTIKKITRRSKYILIYLNDPSILLIHLGMTGRFYFVRNKGKKIDTSFYNNTDIIIKHDHLKINFNKFSLIYNDIRKFGFIKKVHEKNIFTVNHLSKLGCEPLSNKFSFNYLKSKIHNRKSSIKNLLMCQSIVAGLGNIYVNETLYSCKINPEKFGYKIKDDEIRKLARSIKKILKNAILAGGSTINNYHNSEGKIGSYQKNFKVYDREGQDCLRAGCDSKIKRISRSGRSIFYCSKCQT
tara:strand:+ start:4534 stop:5394 length:861 start_codon:yes stop_codon:yes gene_type:complete